MGFIFFRVWGVVGLQGFQVGGLGLLFLGEGNGRGREGGREGEKVAREKSGRRGSLQPPNTPGTKPRPSRVRGLGFSGSLVPYGVDVGPLFSRSLRHDTGHIGSIVRGTVRGTTLGARA